MSKIQGVDRIMAELVDRTPSNELDYPLVMDVLKSYASPRAKLSRLLKDEALIRVRKGLYLLGPRFQRSPYCLELIANMIYGPSYVSLERALQIHGMIPEHVESITSVTLKSPRSWNTPVGSFSYAHCPSKYYPIGVTSLERGDNTHPLIATPEKALTDMLTLKRGKVTSLIQMENILLEDLRIEEEDLLKLDIQRVGEIEEVHPHSAIRFLKKWLEKLRKGE